MIYPPALCGENMEPKVTGTGTGIGSGKSNTEKIVAALGTGDYAAKQML